VESDAHEFHLFFIQNKISGQRREVCKNSIDKVERLVRDSSKAVWLKQTNLWFGEQVLWLASLDIWKGVGAFYVMSN
jgi:hypothetical protein